MKKNLLLKIAYDGTSFWGWQRSGQGPTVEQTLQEVLERILQHSVELQAASRTDRGVHAEGQFVNFLTESHITLPGLKKALNSLLPPSLRVFAIFEAPLAFHPTLHAVKKEYHYLVCNGPIQPPKDRFFSWHVKQPLDLKKMEEGCRYFEGRHDFSSFCNFRKNLNYKERVRHLEKIDIVHAQNEVRFTFLGHSFLYKMVRNLVGTLVYVGLGKIEPTDLSAIMASKNRTTAGVTAPAHGLTLKRVYYPQEFQIEV